MMAKVFERSTTVLLSQEFANTPWRKLQQRQARANDYYVNQSSATKYMVEDTSRVTANRHIVDL